MGASSYYEIKGSIKGNTRRYRRARGKRQERARSKRVLGAREG
jgi:hypothetical protein